MINVTKTFLPPIEKYTAQIERIYQTHQLTNRGKLVLELEEKLRNHLNVSNILITTNGTLPLQIALKLLGGKGEVITTPFSYVATTASIEWEGCKPVFVDIHPDTFTIDETKIENAITENTTCILATHVFGNPCNIEAIDKIAKKHNLKVIYDAAHCFDVKYKNKSIFEYGDVSTCSFHATKLFHTGEGGAVFCKDPELFKQVYFSHNFGHKTQEEFDGLGINAKISELQAAMGLAVLPYVPSLIQKRTEVHNYYRKLLNDSCVFQSIQPETVQNYSYFPVLFKSEEVVLEVKSKLGESNIFPRRYFYPSLNNLPYVSKVKMPISEDVASRILCLPLYHDLEKESIEQIVTIINNCTE